MNNQNHEPRKLSGWGHPRKGPHRRFAHIYPDGAYYVRHHHWLDHLYRLKNGDDVVYVSEPYDLGPDDLEEILALQEEGWRVRLDGHGEHHETTVRVLLSERPRL